MPHPYAGGAECRAVAVIMFSSCTQPVVVVDEALDPLDLAISFRGDGSQFTVLVIFIGVDEHEAHARFGYRFPEQPTLVVVFGSGQLLQLSLRVGITCYLYDSPLVVEGDESLDDGFPGCRICGSTLPRAREFRAGRSAEATRAVTSRPWTSVTSGARRVRTKQRATSSREARYKACASCVESLSHHSG